jgi:hypothetical protein
MEVTITTLPKRSRAKKPSKPRRRLPPKKPPLTHREFNVSALLNHFGGKPNLAKLAKEYHYRGLGVETTRKWQARGRISGKGLLTLINLSHRIEKPLDVSLHMLVTTV